MATNNQECKWTQGYICAIATMIRLNGVSDTHIEEAFLGGIGKVNIAFLISAGCDLDDIEVLKPMIKEINNRHNRNR